MKINVKWENIIITAGITGENTGGPRSTNKNMVTLKMIKISVTLSCMNSYIN